MVKHNGKATSCDQTVKRGRNERERERGTAKAEILIGLILYDFILISKRKLYEQMTGYFNIKLEFQNVIQLY